MFSGVTAVKGPQRVLTTLHACRKISDQTITGMHENVYTHDTPDVVNELELDGSPLVTVQQT